MTTQMSTKSGKGSSHGVVSELTTFFTVKPGHTEELRAACERFNALMHQPEWRQQAQKSGLREWRQVIFDDGRRLLFMTSFETEWDPYIDDAVLVIGIDYIIDWLQHTVEIDAYKEELRQTVVDARRGIATTATLKKVLQAVQVAATSYWDALSDETVPQIRKAQAVQHAFQQVLDNPAAAQVIEHPAMQPLLDQAVD